MNCSPEQIAEYRKDFESTLPTSLVSRGEDGNYSNIYVEFECRGYILARTEQATEIAELKARLAEVIPLAKFGAMVIRSQEFETELAVKCGFLVPNLKAGGYLYTIDQATIEQILKD